MRSEKPTVSIVVGESRTPLDIYQFLAEPRRNPPPTEPTVVAGVLMTELQYSTLADPRFAESSRLAVEQNLPMEMEREGVLWITEPYGIKGVNLRWTPDEQGWRITFEEGRAEHSAPDLPSALKLMFKVVDKRESPEEELLRAIFKRPKSYD